MLLNRGRGESMFLPAALCCAVCPAGPSVATDRSSVKSSLSSRLAIMVGFTQDAVKLHEFMGKP